MNEIIIDLTGTDIGTSIKISSVKLPENVVPTITDRDFVVATLAPPTIEVEETKEEDAETDIDSEKTETDAQEVAPDDKKEESKEESAQDKSK